MNPSALVCLVFLASCISYSYTQEADISGGCGQVINEVPYWHQLSKNITTGSLIYVIGKPHKDARYIQIDLEQTNSQVLTSLSMKALFEKQRTKFFSFDTDVYFRANSTSDSFPFKEEQWFTVVIHVEENQYTVYVDGEKYFTFEPEFDYSVVKYMELKGQSSFLKPIVINP